MPEGTIHGSYGLGTNSHNMSQACFFFATKVTSIGQACNHSSTLLVAVKNMNMHLTRP